VSGGLYVDKVTGRRGEKGRGGEGGYLTSVEVN
jgi:hypothetical protein